MRETSLPCLRPRHRVQGRARLEQRLRRLALQVGRFQAHRATSEAERRWALRVADALSALLSDPPASAGCGDHHA